MAIDRDLNMQLIAAALASARGDNLSDALRQGGGMPDRMRLRDATLAQKEANARNTQLQNLKLEQELTAKTQPLDVPERTYTVQEQNQDLLIANAFGIGDAVAVTVADTASLLDPIGLAPSGGFDAQIAEAAKKQMNFDIKATAADAWRGKPNNFLLQQIIELIPSSYFNGDSRAAARYSVIRNNFASRMSELDGQIKLADPGSASQANLIKTRANVKHMIDRLDVVASGFRGQTPDSDPLSADNFYGVNNVTPGIPLDADMGGIDAMEEMYRAFLEE